MPLDFAPPGSSPKGGVSRNIGESGVFMHLKKWFVASGAVLIMGLTACSKPQQFSVMDTKPVNESELITDVQTPVAKPPTLIFVQFPNGPVSTNENATIVYDIIPGTSPIASVECKVDGVVVACSVEGDTLVVNSPEEGSHLVEIVVTDTNNLQDSGSIAWDAFHRFQKVKLPLNIVGEEDRVDILVVIDISISMRNEQANMAEKINNLLDRVNGLNWRIAIVTTDMVDSTLGDGRLLKFPNGDYFITSQLSLKAAKEQFGKTIQRSEDGNYLEQGVRATYRALQRAIDPKVEADQRNKRFFRAEAALAVIVISDENESGTGVMNTPAELVKYVKSAHGQDKIFKFHSIIVRPGDKTCLDKSPTVHTEGHIYSELTTLTGGVLGDVCAPDYANHLNVIGQDVANTQNTFQLTCVPMDIDGDGQQDVKVTSEGSTPKLPSFILEGDTLVFSKPPKKGKYALEYFCPKK